MAESDTILQLGIEAAREGNREEARNLFGLLTRQEPGNVQAWLWLAGVAEGPEQRRAALERVVELDPTNEMAVKGLQAMGVKPTTKLADADASAPTIAAPVSSPPPAPAREMTDEERYAAELDSAFDDYDALPRTEVPAREPVGDADALDAAAIGERPRTPLRGTARERSAARRGATPIRSDDDDDYDSRASAARRSGPSPLLLGLLGLIVAVLACVVIYSFFLRGRGGGTQVAGDATSQAATAQAMGGLPTEALPGGTLPITSTSGIDSTGGITSTSTPTDTTSIPGGDGASAPTVVPPAGGGVPEPSANPSLQAVGIGEQLSANGWGYTYPAANYTVVLGKQLGSFTTQGNYIHVLAYVANNTGTDQPLPANFFALKDAAGNVYKALPQISSALVQRGVNADVGLEDAIPANGLNTSIYLVFDVPSGAQNLTLFAAGNNGQGWPVLSTVP